MAEIEYQLERDIAVLRLSNPPVNGLSLPLRRSFMVAMQRAADDESMRAIVLCGAGRGFCAGGDIREFGTAAATALPGVSSHMHAAIEASRKPVVAAIHGFAIGGGLETAMACHYRIALADTRVALPEVGLGTIPLSGTQRLPRLIGLGPALDAIAGACTFTARDFGGTPLFDRMIEPTANAPILEAALEFARALPPDSLPLVRDLPLRDPQASALLAQARARYVEETNPAPAWAIDAIEAAVNAPDFDAGLATARRLWQDSMASDQLRERRDRFLS